MKNKKLDVKRLTTLSVLIGIMLVLNFTGIGFIPLPLIKATIMHIPVIIGAILLGPSAGAILGAVFGFCSIWTNTMSPSVVSFAFSPFMTQEGFVGALKAIWIAFGCRVLFGALTGWIWKLLNEKIKIQSVSVGITAVSSTLCHSVFVLGSIYILLAEQYAQAKNLAMSAFFKFIMTTIATSGLAEAFLAALVVIPIVFALNKLIYKKKMVP